MALPPRVAAFVALALSAGCGGETIEIGGSLDGGTPAPTGTLAFVGAWTCADVVTVTLSRGKLPPGESPLSRTDLLTFVPGGAGTLLMTGDTVAIGSVADDAGEACGVYAFAMSGATATLVPATICSSDGATLTATSGSFVLTGSNASPTAVVTLVTAVSPSMSGSTVDPSTSAITGTCTRGVRSDASAD